MSGTKLLHIDASILGGNSVSRQLSGAIVDSPAQGHAGPECDLSRYRPAPLPHLSGAHLAAAHGAVPETAALEQDISASQAVLDEFLAADHR